ncbi:MAG: hypothetical protein KGV57_00020 [Fusobacterium sp.]|nr:hypothetical protein [Fusobacterium sp.]
MQILAVFSSSITIILYFFLSMLIPFLAYLVPYYKIKKVNLKEKKYKILVNLFVASILTLINIKFLIIYLIFPVIMEFMFYLTGIFKEKLKTYDRAILMSLISTIIVSVYISNINLDVSVLKNLLASEHINIDFTEFIKTFSYIKENIVFTAFSYFFVGNLLLIFSLDKKDYSNWEISPYWLLIFMAIIFVDKFMGISMTENFWSRNLVEVVKYVYVWHSIKVIYNLCTFTKINFLKHLISLMLAISYPTLAFVLGALVSFKIIEVENIKISKK